VKVTVVFFGDFARHKPAGWAGKRGTVEVPEGATIDTLANQLGIGDEPCVVMLNEEQNHRGAELHEGDTVTFLPPIAGGEDEVPSSRGHRAHPRLTLNLER
jgi:sulfur carrier protein ThiS